MERSKETRVKIAAISSTLAATILLFAATTTPAPLQQAYSLSEYDIADNNLGQATEDTNGMTYQPLEQEPTNTVRSSARTQDPLKAPNVACVMDTIESLQSFLSCLGAK